MNKQKIVTFASALSALLGTTAVAIAIQPPSAAQCNTQFNRNATIDCAQTGLRVRGIANEVAVTVNLLEGRSGNSQGFDASRNPRTEWFVRTTAINTPKTSSPLVRGLAFHQVGGTPR